MIEVTLPIFCQPGFKDQWAGCGPQARVCSTMPKSDIEISPNLKQHCVCPHSVSKRLNKVILMIIISKACARTSFLWLNSESCQDLPTRCVCSCTPSVNLWRVYDSTVSVTLPLVLFKMPTASSCVTPSRVCPLTAMIWSPLFSRPSSAAAP